MFKWFYRIILIIAFGVAVYAAYFWYQSSNNTGVQLIFKTPNIIEAGQPFDLSVGIANGSDKVLSAARLTIILPEGALAIDGDEDKNIIVRSVGDVGVGGLSGQDFKILATNNASSSLKNIDTILSYATGSSGARFEEKKSFVLNVGSAAVSLNIDVPEKTLSNDSFEIKIAYKNISDHNIDNLKLKIDYPPVFKFTKSTLAPDDGNQIWNLGGLLRGSENHFSVFGKLVAPPQTKADFKVSLQEDLGKKTYDIIQQTSSVVIDSTSFDLQMTVNSLTEFVAHPNDALNYLIIFPNPLDNLTIQLSGEMLDLSDLGSNVLSWPSPTSPVSFKVKVKDYPLKRLGDKNFLIKATAEGRLGKNISVTKLETKIGGQVKVFTKGFFRDATSGILNKGSLPLKVGQATDFTIHWLVSNFGTDVSGIKVRAILPEGVKFAGVSKSNFATSPSYNATSNTINWIIDRLLATQGVIDAPVEGIFQITATPAAVMIGQNMSLLGETTLTATDEFTNENLSAVASAVTTVLPDDATAVGQGIITK